MNYLPEVSFSFILITFVASFVACFFSALSGGGAGLILLPVLMFAGLPFINALASHKLAVGFIGIGATIQYVRKKLLNWRVFWWSALVGIPFVILGTHFAAVLPGETMKPVVGGMILAMVLFSLIKKIAPKTFEPKTLSPKILIIGTFLLVPAAFYSGWISAGSGIFTTMIYLWILKYDQLHANAMTLSANGIFWNGVGAAAHIFMGHIVWALALSLILGAILGSYFGAAVGIKKGNTFLRIIFLITAGITGILLIEPALWEFFGK
jgi:uncharacterized protein